VLYLPLIVSDVIDESAQFSIRTNFDFLDSDGFDNVSGYSIRQLEDALIGQRTWNGWRDNIKNKYDNATETNIDALFAAYE
jgi:hypothetical protein